MASNIQPIRPPPDNPLPLNASVTRNFPRARLSDLSGGPRFAGLDRYHAFLEGTQDDDKEYDWDGYFKGYGIEAAIKPGWYVPFSMRKPRATIPLAKDMVGRLTSMLLGDQNRPLVKVEGDEDAQEFVRAIVKASRLFQKFIEARMLGGSCGAVPASYGLVKGHPRIEIHNVKHCRVLAWKDRAEVIPSAVLKSYIYDHEVYSESDGKYKEEQFWYVRYWDEEWELVWEAIPDKAAKDRRDWWNVVPPDRSIKHGAEECPVVWIQNIVNSQDPDGKSDYHGQLTNLDELNRLQSATSKGTLANADPTLVIKSRKAPAPVKKGSKDAIFSEGGAEYLTLNGDGMRAATEEKMGLRDSILGACGVVIPSAEKLSGAAQSAAAIRLLFAPMTARCDILREQYGEMGIVRVLAGLLKLCKAAYLTKPDSVILPPRLKPEVNEEEGESELQEVPHVPGEREDITLEWPTYFPPTWTEKKEAASTAKEANGGKPVISHKTAVRSVAQLFGVEDADAELAAIENDTAAALDQQAAEMKMLAEFAPEPQPGAPPGKKQGGVGGPGTPPREPKKKK